MDDMICNFRKCRKTLSSFGWVTSCSHIFCDEDGTREFNKSYSCPACETKLPGKFDIVRIDLSPSEQYKSMLLAGQKPEVILEVCSRAMAFWTYQIHQERIYQEYISNKLRQKSTQLEQYYEQLVTRTQTEVTSLKNQISALQKELDSTKRRFQEVSEKAMEKSRQHQKLQLMYDALRRKSISVSSLDQCFEGRENKSRSSSVLGGAFDHPFSSTEGEMFPHGRGPGGDRDVLVHHTPAEREFVFKPTEDGTCGTPRRNRNTPLGSHDQMNQMHVQNRFNMELGTPNEVTRRLGHRKM